MDDNNNNNQDINDIILPAKTEIDPFINDYIKEKNPFFTIKNIIFIIVILVIIIFLIVEIIKLITSYNNYNYQNKNYENTDILDLSASLEGTFDGTFENFEESLDDIILFKLSKEFNDKTINQNIKTYEYISDDDNLLITITGVKNYNNSLKLAKEFHDYYEYSSTPSNKTINNITWNTVRINGLISSSKYYFTNHKNRLYKIQIDFTNEELLNKHEEELLNGIIFRY